MELTHGFEFIEECSLAEYRARGLRYRHRASGADLFHVRNDDPENLFAFAFKTLPTDSTGIAHILEHTVLCGSRDFPVKDPFIRLVKGSLNTFLNAMTYPDKTVYPAASTVPQDLFNIMRVYGDAVFFPLLREEFFRQEGHRLHYVDGKLDLTGIVYNEMKGVYADHDSLAGRSVHQALLSDTPYGHDSGGDPAAIPDLTYEEFVRFHTANYHPSNCLIFLYGDIPTERYLEFLDRNFLSRFDAADADGAGPPVPLQPRWSQPREFVVTCPTDGDEGPTSVSLSWLISGDHAPEDVLGLELLSYILLGSSAGPLRRRLIESGLGDDLSASTGIETDLREIVFSAGLRDTDAERKDEIVTLILDTLREIARDGIDADLVEASLRKVEFRHREIKGGGPNGLRLMGKSLRGWLHGADPQRTLAFASPFARVRERVAADPRYFQAMIEEHLLGNTHRLLSMVVPDPGQREREHELLDSRLSKIEASMGDDERARVIASHEALAALQAAPDSPDALAKLPFLHVGDLPREIDRIPTAHETIGQVPLYVHDVATNGIVYLDVGFDLNALTNDLLAYVPLYVDAFGELGLPGREYDEVITEIGMKAGGVSSFHEVGIAVDGDPVASRRLVVRLKTLESTLPEAVDLLAELLLHARFSDARRVADLFKEARSSMSGSVLPAGHSYAAVRAGRAFSDSHRYGELWQGATQLLFMNETDESGDALGDRLARINTELVDRSNALLNVTAPADVCERARPHLERLLAALPARGSGAAGRGAQPLPFERIPRMEALIVPSDVGYAALCMRGARMGGDDHVHEQVLSNLLRTGYLWETVRMKGGAYGVSAGAHGMDSSFGFWSYRDPNVVASLRAFRESLEHTASSIDNDGLEHAVIGVAGRYLHPQSPSQKALVALRRTLYRIPDELRVQNYHALLSTRAHDIRRTAERLMESIDDNSVVVLAGADAIDRAARDIPGLGDHRVQLPV